MANNVIDAVLRFTDKFTTPFQTAIRNAENNTKKLNSVGYKFQKTGKAITKTGTSLTKTVTLPIVAAGVTAVKTAANFESAMSKVQSISSASSSDMAKLSEKAREMGAKTKFSATEAADAFSYMAMAGWKTQDMMDGIEGVMYLAGASGEDLAQTSDIVTDALTAFGMTAKDTNRFVDVLAAASNNANTNVSMLGESFKYCAPIAGAMKYSVNDVAVNLGLMANSGIKASQAGTSLRALFTNLAKPTDTVQAAMDRLGISLVDSKGKMLPLAKLTKNLRKAFSGLTEAEKTKEAAALAGKTGMSGLLAIVNSSTKDYNKLTKAINNSSGAAKKMYDVANNNFSGRLTVFKSTLESIAIDFGNLLLPAANKALARLQKLAEHINSMSPKNKKLAVSILATVAAAGPALILIGKMTMGVGSMIRFGVKLVRFFKAIKNGTSVLAVLGTSGVAGIAVVGIIAIVAAVAVLVTHWKQVKKACEPAIKFMRQGITKAKTAIASGVKAIKSHLIKMANSAGLNTKKLRQQFTNMGVKLAQIKANLKVTFSEISAAVKIMAAKIKPPLNAFKKGFVSVFNKVKGPMQAFIKFLISMFTIKIRVQFAIVKSIAVALFKGLSDVVDSIMTIFKGITEFLEGAFTGNWRKVFQGLADIVRGAFSGLVAVVKTPINGIIGVVNSAINAINGIHVSVPKWVPGVGGKSIGFSIGTIPMLYRGTQNWGGGPAIINEKAYGGEIVDLPSGSRVYPHDKSVQMAYSQGKHSNSGKVQKVFNFTIGTVNASTKADAEAFCKMIMDMIDNADDPEPEGV